MKESPDRALKSTKWTFVSGQGFYNAFKCESFQLSVVADELTFSISEVTKADCDKINQCPDTTSTCSEKHKDTRTSLSDIESVDTKASAEKA